MSLSNQLPSLSIRVTRSAYVGRGGVVFNGVEVCVDTLATINAKAHFVIKIEESDVEVLLAEIKRGIILDVTVNTRFEVKVDYGFKRYIITTKEIAFLRPKGQMIVDLLGSSSKFKGIGPVKAKTLWGHFGERLVEVLDNAEVDLLTEKLSIELATNAIEAWQSYVRIKELEYCHSVLGLNVSISLRVSQFYQQNTIKKLSDDPYRLLAFGITFENCDFIAMKLGYALDDNIRLSAAVEQALYDVLATGSTIASHDDLLTPLYKILSTSSDEEFAQEIAAKALEQEYECENYKLLSDGRYQSNGAFFMESFVAKRIFTLIQSHVQPPANDYYIPLALDVYESSKGFELTMLQREAVVKAFQHKFLIINGGAGVGKTTVLDAMYQVFEKKNICPIQVALAGKAAKRMAETTGYESFTIARFIRIFDFNAYLGKELVIVIDESSMVDLPSMYRLLKFIPRETRIIMLGDVGQLPPVDFGLIFHELVELDDVPKVTLTEVKRQEKSSNIPKISNDIRHGLMPEFTFEDVQLIPITKRTEIQKLAASMQLENPNSTQIICPTNKMTDAINLLCTDANKRKPIRVFVEDFDRYLDTEFKVGDKVMCCKNLYDFNVMNGSVGEVISRYNTMREVTKVEDNVEIIFNSFGQILWDDGIEREITIEVVDALKHAYAITIHKSQGSQFDTVIIPLDRAPNLDRTMLYTAITRAQKSVIFIGNPLVIESTLNVQTSKNRNVHLQEKLNLINVEATSI
jgi:exodeoxyribonuclease V alpha subunit